MQRREFLPAALALASGIGAAHAQKKPAAAGAAAAHAGHVQIDAALIDAASECEKRGRLCLSHCVSLLSAGDTSMAGCARAVTDMLTLSQALSQLASAGSRHTRAAARLIGAALGDCEAECKKHAEQHEACRLCAECCGRLAKEAARAAA